MTRKCSPSDLRHRANQRRNRKRNSPSDRRHNAQWAAVVAFREARDATNCGDHAEAAVRAADALKQESRAQYLGSPFAFLPGEVSLLHYWSTGTVG